MSGGPDDPRYRYRLGDWVVDDARDLDEFFERLADLRRCRGAKITPFPARTADSNPISGERATVIPFGPVQRPAIMREFDLIRNAYFDQRRRADDRIRQGKIARIRAEIEALTAQDLPVETEVRLDILRREFAEVRVKEGESLLDIYMEEGEE